MYVTPLSATRLISRAVLIALLALGLVAVGVSPGQASPRFDSVSTNQVVTWGASADRVGGTYTDQTVRNIVHTSTGGDGLRVSLSNVFGDRTVTFDSVYVGRQAEGANVAAGTNQRVTFSGGYSAVSIPAGAEALSDPLGAAVPADTNLAVSIHVAAFSGNLTGHNLATQTSYVSAVGDQAAQEAGSTYALTSSHWYWVDALVVDKPKHVGTVAAFGDSITDGYGSTVGANHRYPDYLADRIAQQPSSKQFGVMNEGISGNKVLADGAGVSALARFDRDVLSQPDVRTVILLEGINDIGGGVATSADQLIRAYRQLIARAHSENTCIVGGTMTPFKGSGYYSEQKEAIRVAVNEFVRTSNEFDSVVDFDRATRDPSTPQRFLSAYDVGDHLHPNDAGYQAMAAVVDLSDLKCTR